jgi:hypothetical protein
MNKNIKNKTSKFILNSEPSIELKNGQLVLTTLLKNTDELETLTPILDFSNCLDMEDEGDQIYLSIETPLRDILDLDILNLQTQGPDRDLIYTDQSNKQYFDQIKTELTNLISKIDNIVYVDEIQNNPHYDIIKNYSHLGLCLISNYKNRKDINTEKCSSFVLSLKHREERELEVAYSELNQYLELVKK